MDDSGTSGGQRTASALHRVAGLFEWNAAGRDDRLKGYASYVEASADQRAQGDRDFVKKPARQKAVQQRLVTMADASTPQERYALNRYLAWAKEAASRMVAAAGVADGLELMEAGAELHDHLRGLWRLRKAREDEWAEVLNFVQSALAGEAVDSFTVEQCLLLKKIVFDHLALGVVDEDQPFRVRRLLREAGLDPWKGISQRCTGDLSKG